MVEIDLAGKFCWSISSVTGSCALMGMTAFLMLEIRKIIKQINVLVL